MMSRWRWLLLQFSRRLWLRVSLLAMIGVATAAAGIILAPYVPDAWTIKIGAKAIDGILNVLASSMLAVTVFSLSTMVAAYSAATNNVTPRATKLLMQDNTSQNVLGTFIGSFLFSLVGIIALGTGLYGPGGRAILLVVTIGLIGLIAVTILRWIDYLARFGRLTETIDRVEAATWTAMKTRLTHQHLGGRPLQNRKDAVPKDSVAVFAQNVGYVQHIDTEALQDCAKAHDAEVFVTALPGVFVDPSRPVAHVMNLGDGMRDAVIKAFSIGVERTFDQDPRFGLCVLAEIASRALSPAVNDPGTAIDVIGRAVRLLVNWAGFQRPDAKHAVKCPLVWVPAITAEDLFDDVFAPIARDGAGMIEVQLRLQKAFRALAATDRGAFGPAAQRHSGTALERAEAALLLASEKASLREIGLAGGPAAG